MSGGWQGSASRGFPTKTRARILQRDPTCRCTGCQYHDGPCGQASTDADHLRNVAQGGTDHESNGQGLCSRCHRAKTQAEAMATRIIRGRRRPAEPHPGMRPAKGGG